MNPVWSTANNTFQFAFTNVPGASFSVLTSSKLALPLTNWTISMNVTEILPGQYYFLDTQARKTSQKFYRVRSP